MKLKRLMVKLERKYEIETSPARRERLLKKAISTQRKIDRRAGK